VPIWFTYAPGPVLGYGQNMGADVRRDDSWVALLPSDPVPWLLESDEPAARWIALTGLLDRPMSDPEVLRAHEAVLADPLTADLLDRISPWELETPLSGHDKPEFAPNLLGLLADMGVTAEDDDRIAGVLGSMLEHQAEDGRFLALGRWRGQDEAAWAALPCDSHAIAETLARAGFGDDPRVCRAFDRIAADLAETRQGRAWLCRPDPVVAFRGPGRRDDMCPQVTLEALRAFSYLRPERRPADVIAAGRVSLGVWRNRGSEKPYVFGHGRQFKRTKWPPTWYSAFEVVDALGRHPELWDGPYADPADRRALAELAACLVAYNFDGNGHVVPRSCFRGFERHSFGQKKLPSPYATARTSVAVRRLSPLAEDIALVDVMSLGSSKGGTGIPLAP
jgi:hypothetical protein